MNDLLIPDTSTHEVVTYEVLVDNNQVSQLYQLLSISILKNINRVPYAKIIFRDGEAAARTFATSDADDFIPGKKVTIHIGRDGTNSQAFQGIIVKHAVRVKENGDSELHVECFDAAVKMTLGRFSKYYQNVKDSDVFDTLIKKYSDLKSNIKPTKLNHEQLVQHHISDWDFLLLRAEANGMLVNVSDGTINIAAPDTSTNPVLQVTYGSSALEFEAEMDARNQWKSVQAHSWDYSNQQLFKADAASPNFTESGNVASKDLANATSPDNYELHHSGHLLQQELQDWVDGSLLRSRIAKIRGRAKCKGFAGVKPGDMVTLQGVGKRFNGNVYVTAVRQDIGEGMWDTQIQFGLDPRQYAFIYNEDIYDMQTSGLVGSINGLQIGKVVQLQNDPDGEDRILIKTPTLDNDARGIWTRVASLDAGKDRGAFFRPEIDDEVIIGFINDDPRHAVMLGMLNSSAKPAPIKAKDSNDEKGFTTRSKMHISFNDQTKTITIDTPAGNHIILDEQAPKIEIQDQSKNKITMDSSGIKVESPMEIQVSAGTNLTLKADSSISIQALNISVNADSSLSLQGNTSAQLSSSVVTQITGTPVKIN
ncbi:MAG TPA: type VI secretion system tip protein VgrG [Puia sp.]|nr:type VI secretion system tip protein VgrG [Puia sp.]